MRRVIPLLIVVALCSVACRKPVVATLPSKPRISRDEFTKEIIGKSPQQTVERLGSPDAESQSGRHNIYTYYDVTFDPVTRKSDHVATVWFTDNIAVSTAFGSK